MPKKIPDNPYLEERGEELAMTDSGRKWLDEVVTDTEGPVYAFHKPGFATTAAAAMARLSRRGSDLREIILDEFALQGEADEELLKRVITAYGDDSVQQLDGIHVVVEGASNLLTKLLEWPRLASYLEQSTRYIPFDQKVGGHYRWHLPRNLPGSVEMTYMSSMDRIFDIYSQMLRALTAHVQAETPRPDRETDRDGWAAWPGATRAQALDAVRPVLPVATQSTVGIFASAQAMDNLIMFLFSQGLTEAQQVGQAILEQVRRVSPVFFERTDREDRGLMTVAYRRGTREAMRAFAKEALDHSAASQASGEVRLVDYWPQHEFDLVPEMLFEASGLSVREIQRQVDGWSEDLKRAAFEIYMGERLNRRHRPGRAIEKAHFEWELDGRDYGTFRDLQRHRMVDAFEWQRLHPHFGYDVPELVVEAGLEPNFRRCFEVSESLFEELERAGCGDEAQYAVLLGHNMRYRFIANLRELFHLIELRTQVGGHPGYRRICNEMYRLLTGVYPTAAQAMKFVNQSDNLDQLTRMASERNTAAKLRGMGADHPEEQ